MIKSTDDSIVQTIDGVSFKLSAPFDFEFLKEYGRVFKVFDDQDSGNICFGLAKGDERYFLKFAGAPTARSTCPAEQAIESLRSSVPLYRALRHDNLIELLDAGEAGAGYAALFRWADGICMGRMYEEDHAKFMAIPIRKRVKIYADVLKFLIHVNAQGYFAVDFYDGSVMYDEKTGKTTICDIDFFRRKPCVNDMGRMWGSSKFMSPEEFQRGAVLDEVTNVYTAGAMAFALFGGYSKEENSWTLPAGLYVTAAKATSDDRSLRQQSLLELWEEWESAIKANRLGEC